MKVHIEGIPDNMIANNLTSSFAIHPGEVIKDERLNKVRKIIAAL